ncbi:M23 family metallopeptidase [Microbacterium sp. SORGH_AS_0421]|uniref:M23 family metallopeptidase n=1 Tax=Microbacterium sp. SORGH_AS_0421 TaxID=3041768 RepID=UPI00278DC0B3|nr:M23 family metallopeptidase [Microbacterium sp. SORGH_AS_0421]MDQ1177907.1 hypothetical protein [Microbacterium sp. SORGH_AS_0421]
MNDADNSGPLSGIGRREALSAGALAVLAGIVFSATPASALAQTPGGMFYPTDPWRYLGGDGQKYLDPRENGRRHMGIDSQGDSGAAIHAVMDGTVVGGQWGTTTGDGHGWGNFVRIDHGQGVQTLYAHFALPPSVARGSHVQAGQRIGTMGGTQYGANRLSRHLHFEVFRNGSNVDPLAFLSNYQSNTPAPAPAPRSGGVSENIMYIRRQSSGEIAIFGGSFRQSNGGQTGRHVFANLSEYDAWRRVVGAYNSETRRVGLPSENLIPEPPANASDVLGLGEGDWSVVCAVYGV